MATKKVETAEIKPKVTRAKKEEDKLPRGWQYSKNYIVCPKCGFEGRINTIKSVGHCPLCGERFES